MEPLAVAVLAAIPSVAVSLVGLWVARRKGLPAINAEIEARQLVLVDTLQDQLEAMRTDMGTCKGELSATKTELTSTKRDLRATQLELLELYRRTGQVPPRSLEGRADG